MKGRPWRIKGVIATLTALKTLIDPGSAHTAYLCKGTITVSTPKATGKVHLCEATAGAAIWNTSGSPTAVTAYVGHFSFDYGEDGIPLTKGKALKLGEATATQTAYYLFNGYIL